MLDITKLSSPFSFTQHIDSSYPEGNFEGNQLLGGSISLSPLYAIHCKDLHVTTHCVPPTEFLLSSDCSRKVHHLSGPSSIALTQIYQIGLAALTNQCNRRSVDGADALHLEPRVLPPQAGTGAPLFTFITRPLPMWLEKAGFLAPFHSQYCWTPRSVFQDGSNNEGSPLLHLGVRRFCEFRFSLASSTTAPANPLTGARVFEAR